MTEEKGGSRRKSSGALISVEEKRSYGEERAWRRSRQGGGRKIRQAGITGGSQQKMVPGRGEKSCQTLLTLGIIIHVAVWGQALDHLLIWFQHLEYSLSLDCVLHGSYVSMK